MTRAGSRGLRAPCFISFIALVLGVAGPVQAQWQPYWSLETTSYSEPLSVHAMIDELDGHLRSGERAFTLNRFEIGVARGPWTLSAYSRYDYHLKFSKDSAELVHHGENDLPVDANRDYDIDLNAQHLFAHGLKVGFTHAVTQELNLGLSLAYINGQSLIDGTVYGDISTDNLSTFSGEAFVSYRYSEDVLLHRPVDEPKGHGYSVDLEAQWQATERLTLRLAAYDLISAIYWQDAPYTSARLTSATVDFDADGFINTTPLLAGVEGQDDYRQTLPVRTHSGAVYRVNPRLSWSLQHMNLEGLDLVQVGMNVTSTDATRWGLHYDTTAQAVLFNAERNGFKLSLGMDNLDYRRARYLSVAASVNLRF